MENIANKIFTVAAVFGLLATSISLILFGISIYAAFIDKLDVSVAYILLGGVFLAFGAVVSSVVERRMAHYNKHIK